MESEEAEEKRAKEQKEKRESKEKKKEAKAKEKKLKEEKLSEANKKKEKEEKDAKRKKKDKESKESSATGLRVSPRRASAPMQQLCAPRKDRAKHATPTVKSVTLEEHVEEQPAIRSSPRFLATHPVPPVKKSAKPTATTSSVTTKIPAVHSLGLPSAAEAPRIGKAATALSVKDAQRLTSAEETFLQSRIASCDRNLTNVAKNITLQDRASLENYVRETKVRMIRALTHRSRDGLTPETLRAMTKLAPTTPDLPTVMESATATSSSMRIGDASEAISMSASASMSVNSPSSEATPASSAAASSVTTSATASLVGIPPDRPWTGTFILPPIPPPHVLLANRPELAVRNVSPTDLVSEFD